MKRPLLSSELDEQQRERLQQLAATLRTLNNRLPTLKADCDTLDALNTSAAALLETVEQQQSGKVLEHFCTDWQDDFNKILPGSPITGYFNPIAPPVKVFTEGEQVVGEVTLERAYEGPPESVHGGIVAGIFDQLLAMANIAKGVAGPTASLTIEYLKPTPILQPLRFICRTAHIDERKITAEGELLQGDELLAKATGLFIRYEPR